MDPPSSIPVRPSGIPRPSATTSRLPVLKASTSQSQLRERPSVSSLSRPGSIQPTVQKKPSRTSLARPTLSTSSTLKRTVPSSSHRRPSNDETSVFKKPIGRPQSRQSRVKPSPTPSRGNINREEDGLGDLEGFRSSSRASSRAGFRDNEPDYTREESTKLQTLTPRKSTPSLVDRTIESLSHLPSSPAGKGRRNSGFFNHDNSMPPPSRPASAMGNNRRPTTSDGTPKATPTTPRRTDYGSLKGSLTVPGKRSLNAALPTRNISTPSKLPSQSGPASQVKKQPLSQVQNIQTTPRARLLANSKTLGRTPKSRPSLAGIFGEDVSPSTKVEPVTPSSNREVGLTNRSPASDRKVSSSSKALREQIAKAKAARKSNITANSLESAETSESPRAVSSSSGALREQIARAKEAARRANASKKAGLGSAPKEIPAVTENEFGVVPDPAEIAEFDFGLDDPFNQRPKGSKSLLRKRIDAGRMDGRLNIAAMGLKEIPEDVLTMYKYDPDDNNISWGEVVDLTTIIAADNEIASLPDGLFPDVEVNSFEDSDDDGPQFGALHTIDLHGNVLCNVPVGFRHLTQLTKLNLSRNQLENGVFDIFSQISSLRELRCSENAFRGVLPQSLGRLTNLEVLDLQGNQLTGLPDEIQELVRLRTLNISDNQIATMPPSFFASVPIVEFLASKNRFSGSFFTVDAAPHLQTLQLSNNAITSLCEAKAVSLPALKTINISANRLSSFPDMSSWESLVTILAGENKFTSLPDEFFSLPRLRIADFSSNDITKLDERIALMETLENFTIAANPLRERKFLTMNTEDMKRDLMTRLEPSLLEAKAQSGSLDDDTVVDLPPHTGDFMLKPSGTLDLSARGLSELEDDKLIPFADENPIRQLKLDQNCFTFIPTVLTHLVHLTVLDLSNNSIIHPFTDNATLPRLQELRLANNKLQSFSELLTYLSAPGLQRLDITNNRISGQLPKLRDAFPGLSLLLAADNAISEVPAETLEGLKVVNLSNNEIPRLDPLIGLYAGTLTSLEVEGNTFRVPNYKILQKGTDAVLTWLRDKIPSDEF